MRGAVRDRPIDHCSLRVEGRIWTGGQQLQRGVMLVEGERVLWIGNDFEAPATAADCLLCADDEIVVPGLVDVHVHGGAGHDVVDGTQEALEAVLGVHARHGTTACCPTIISAPPSQTLLALEHLKAVAGTPRGGGARVLGANLEGPFINEVHAGAQPREFLRLPDPVLMDEFLAAAGPTLRIVTIAPELPGALGLIERLRNAGVTVAMGHSGATFVEAQAAICAGCRLSTHTCNAMRGMHHREVGIVGAALLSPEVVAEVIADGRHVSPPMLELLWRIKGPSGLALVSDCTAALEVGGEAARLGSVPLTVDGGDSRDASGALAGTAITMATAVRRFARFTGASLPEAMVAASVTPAAVVGVGEVGSIAQGCWADFVVVDQHFHVRSVWVGGRAVHDAREDGRR